MTTYHMNSWSETFAGLLVVLATRLVHSKEITVEIVVHGPWFCSILSVTVIVSNKITNRIKEKIM